MNVDISTISFNVRKTLAALAAVNASSAAPSLGQVQQLVVAAFGYDSVAAYRASIEEPTSYVSASHIVLDKERVMRRQVDFGFPDSANIWKPIGKPGISVGASASVVKPVIRVIREIVDAHFPDVRVLDSEEDLFDDLRDEVESAINDSNAFASEFGLTNANGGDYSTEFEAADLNVRGDEWIVKVTGTCSLEHDPDKVFHGSQIDVKARVVFDRAGRRVLSGYDIDEISAQLEDIGDPDY